MAFARNKTPSAATARVSLVIFQGAGDTVPAPQDVVARPTPFSAHPHSASSTAAFSLIRIASLAPPDLRRAQFVGCLPNLLPHELLDLGRPNAVERAQYRVLFGVLALLTNRLDVKPTFFVLAEGQVFAALDLATALAFAHSQKNWLGQRRRLEPNGYGIDLICSVAGTVANKRLS